MTQPIPLRPIGDHPAATATAVAALGALGLIGLAWLQVKQLRCALHRAGPGVAEGRCFEHRPRVRRARVLVLGDSTGVGIGATTPRQSLAGLLGAEFPQAEVVNCSVAGARLADVLRQCREHDWPARSFDLVLLHVGGNDVLRLTDWSAMSAEATELLGRLRHVGRRTIWLGMANIGLSPLFIAPFSWWLSARTRRASRLFAACARDAGVEFVSFFREHGDDIFSKERDKYFSADGLHPSSQSYRYCWEVLKRQTRLPAALRQAAAAAGRGKAAHATSLRPWPG